MKKLHWYATGVAVTGIAFGILLSSGFQKTVHWAGTTEFCGTFCHSMDATYAAYQKGLHAKTPSGATAGCSDCHLLNEANKYNGPLDYTRLLIDKAVAGSHSGIGELRGTLDTPEKQLAKREEMAASVKQQMKERKFAACLACHDVEKMHDAKKPIIGNMHRMMKDKQTDCLSCHPTAGHDYRK